MDAQGVGGGVDDGEVGVAVLVEVAHDDRLRHAARRDAPDREAARAVADEQADRAGGTIGDHEIPVPIDVEVGRRERDGAFREHRRLCREGAVATPEQHDHVVVVAAGHGDVAVVVAIEIVGDHIEGSIAGGNGARSGERARAVAEEHGHVVADAVGHDQVEIVVFVEVVDLHAPRGRARAYADCCCKATRAVAEKNADVVGVPVGAGDVDVTVFVEVAGGDALGTIPGSEGDEPAEGPRPIAKEYRHGVVVPIGEGEVLVPVFVEVGHGHAARLVADRVAASFRERAGAVAVEEHDLIAGLVGDRQVVVRVLIEIAAGQPDQATAYSCGDSGEDQRRRIRRHAVETEGRETGIAIATMGAGLVHAGGVEAAGVEAEALVDVRAGRAAAREALVAGAHHTRAAAVAGRVGVAVGTHERRRGVRAGARSVAGVDGARVAVVHAHGSGRRVAGHRALVAHVHALGPARAGIAASRAGAARARVGAIAVEAIVAGGRVRGMRACPRAIADVVGAHVAVVGAGRIYSHKTRVGVLVAAVVALGPARAGIAGVPAATGRARVGAVAVETIVAIGGVVRVFAGPCCVADVIGAGVVVVAVRWRAAVADEGGRAADARDAGVVGAGVAVVAQTRVGRVHDGVRIFIAAVDGAIDAVVGVRCGTRLAAGCATGLLAVAEETVVAEGVAAGVRDTVEVLVAGIDGALDAVVELGRHARRAGALVTALDAVAEEAVVALVVPGAADLDLTVGRAAIAGRSVAIVAAFAGVHRAIATGIACIDDCIGGRVGTRVHGPVVVSTGN